MTRINLPPSGRENGKVTGCYGLEFPNGDKVTGRPGKSVDVDDHQAAQIRASSAGKLGVISGSLSMSFGTRHGMRCGPCNRLWNAWNVVCPRCGEQTTSVSDVSSQQV